MSGSGTLNSGEINSGQIGGKLGTSIGLLVCFLFKVQTLLFCNFLSSWNHLVYCSRNFLRTNGDWVEFRRFFFYWTKREPLCEPWGHPIILFLGVFFLTVYFFTLKLCKKTNLWLSFSITHDKLFYNVWANFKTSPFASAPPKHSGGLWRIRLKF